MSRSERERQSFGYVCVHTLSSIFYQLYLLSYYENVRIQKKKMDFWIFSFYIKSSLSKKKDYAMGDVLLYSLNTFLLEIRALFLFNHHFPSLFSLSIEMSTFYYSIKMLILRSWVMNPNKDTSQEIWAFVRSVFIYVKHILKALIHNMSFSLFDLLFFFFSLVEISSGENIQIISDIMCVWLLPEILTDFNFNWVKWILRKVLV